MVTRIKHIKLNRRPSDQLYYENLARIVARYVSDLFAKCTSSKTKPRIVDIGCGTGEIMASIAEHGLEVTGIDVQVECASKSKSHGKVIVADLMTLDSTFPEGSFDLVICSHVLEHMQNPKKAVEILQRITSRWIIVVVPNLTRLANFMLRKPRYINEDHLQGWNSHHLKTFLELNCCLRIVDWITDGVYLGPLHKSFLLKSKVLNFLEYKVLPLLIPQMTNSLIVLCEGR
jgi:SAM-dependent methyltransferase